MEEAAGVIADYVAGLGRHLAFDRTLARDACREIEDHLREAAAAVGGTDPVAAERCAVARFGDAQAVATALTQVAVARGNRRAGAAAILVVAGAFAAMKLRLAWYAAAAMPPTRAEWQAASHAIGLIDRYAFWTAALVGIGTWVYLVSRGRALDTPAAGRHRQRRFLHLCGATAGALLVSIAADGVLTALRTVDADLAINLVPLVSLAVEVAGAGVFVACIGRLRAKARASAALLDG